MLGHQHTIISPQAFKNALINDLDVAKIEEAQTILLLLANHVIRPISPADSDAIKDNSMIVAKNFPENVEILSLLINNNGIYKDNERTYYYHVLSSGNHIYGQIVYSHNDQELIIHALELTNEYRNQKFEVILINDVLLKANVLGLATVKLKMLDNNSNLGSKDQMRFFYNDLGFRPNGIQATNWWTKTDKMKAVQSYVANAKNDLTAIFDSTDNNAKNLYSNMLQDIYISLYIRQIILGHLNELVNRISVNCSNEIKAKVVLRCDAFKEYVRGFYGITRDNRLAAYNAAYNLLKLRIEADAVEEKPDRQLHVKIEEECRNRVKNLLEGDVPICDDLFVHMEKISSAVSENIHTMTQPDFEQIAAQKNNLLQEIESLKAIKEKELSEIKFLNDEKQRLNQDNWSLNEENESLKEKNHKLKKENISYTRNHVKLSKQLGSTSEQYEMLKSETEKLEEHKYGLNTDILQSSDKLSSLKNQVIITQEALSVLSNQTALTRDQLSDLETQRNLIQSEIPELYKRLTYVKNELHNIEKEKNLKLSDLSELNAIMAQVLSYKENIEKKYQDLEKQLPSLETKNGELTKANDALDKQIKESKENFDTIKNKITQSYIELSTLNTKLIQASNQYSAITNQIQSLNQFLQIQTELRPQNFITGPSTQSLKRSVENLADVENLEGGNRKKPNTTGTNSQTTNLFGGYSSPQPLSSTPSTIFSPRAQQVSNFNSISTTTTSPALPEHPQQAERSKLLHENSVLVRKFIIYDRFLRDIERNINVNKTIPNLNELERKKIDIFLYMLSYSKSSDGTVLTHSSETHSKEQLQQRSMIIYIYFEQNPKEKELFSIKDIAGDKITLLDPKYYDECYDQILLPLYNYVKQLQNNGATQQLNNYLGKRRS